MLNTILRLGQQKGYNLEKKCIKKQTFITASIYLQNESSGNNINNVDLILMI